jgi:hypothetical protein
MKFYIRISDVYNVLRIHWTVLSHRVLCVVMLFMLPLGMYGCISPISVKVYDGPERSLREVAVVIVDMNRSRIISAGPRIQAIDRHKVNNEALEYHLLPGEHTIDFTFRGIMDGERGYTKEPWQLHENFRKGHVYRIFANFVGWDPDERFPRVRASWPFGGAKGYYDEGLVLLGTVEDVACSPELLPDHEGHYKLKALAFGGLVGYITARAPASAWKRLAEDHCPDKTR